MNCPTLPIRCWGLVGLTILHAAQGLAAQPTELRTREARAQQAQSQQAQSQQARAQQARAEETHPRERVSPPAVAADRQYLLLANGEVVAGRLQITQDHFQIVPQPGIAWKIHQRDVVTRGRSLEELYRFQFRETHADDLDAQLRLAEWCLVQSLFRQCASHISAAYRLRPDDPRAESLEVRLRAAFESDNERADPNKPSKSQRPNDELVPRSPRRVASRHQRNRRAATASRRDADPATPATDPFDPERFNRDHSPRRVTTATVESPSR